MMIHHFGGDTDCDTPEKLRRVLNFKYGEKGVNEFLLAERNKYPHMAIMVKGRYAVVTYFPEDDQMFQAVDRNNGLNQGESSIFFTGNSELEIEIYNEFVILFEKAVEAAIHFFNVQVLPSCLEWSKQ